MAWLNDIFMAFLRQNARITVVILTVLAVRALICRLPKKYSYMLWGIVGIRMLFNIRISTIFSLFNLFPDRSGSFGVSAGETAWGGGAPQAAVAGGAGEDTGAVAVGSAALDQGAADVTTTHILAVIWIAGMLFLILYGVFSYIKCRRRVRYAVQRERNVWECGGLPSPFVLGLWRPRIFIPFHLSEQERAYILAHERYHIRRGDMLVKPLGFLLLAVYWFNPFVWAAYCLMTRDMELSCDEAVLRGLDGEARREYGALLLSFAVGRSRVSFAPLAFGESDSFRRIRHVLNFKRPSLWATAAGVLLLALTALLCLTNRAVSEEGGKYTLRPELLQYRDMTCAEYRALTGMEPEFYHGGLYSGALPDMGLEMILMGTYEDALGGYRLEETAGCMRLQGRLAEMLVMDEEPQLVERFLEQLADGCGTAPEYAYSDGAGTAYYVDDYYVSIAFDSDRDGENDALLEIALGSGERMERVGPDSAAWLYFSLPERADTAAATAQQEADPPSEEMFSESEQVDNPTVEATMFLEEMPKWLSPNMRVAQGEYSLRYTVEGEEVEEAAWLVYGDGYRLLIPKEGYTLYAPDAWKSENNDAVQLWITHFSEDMPAVRALLEAQGWTESPYDGMEGLYRQTDGVMMQVQFFRNDEMGIWGAFYSYPDTPEMTEGFGTRLRAMAWSAGAPEERGAPKEQGAPEEQGAPKERGAQ
ncbi:MAG: M56 family metallopeptidase [Roseburia sp.]|nr:M56 family metallopeptidase [Roseburia sp.]